MFRIFFTLETDDISFTPGQAMSLTPEQKFVKPEILSEDANLEKTVKVTFDTCDDDDDDDDDDDRELVNIKSKLNVDEDLTKGDSEEEDKLTLFPEAGGSNQTGETAFAV